MANGEGVVFVKREGMTLKGCQKKILQIKNPKSEWFEEAYFILKPSAKDVVEDDIVREAERVLKETSTGSKEKRRMFSWEDGLVFLLGITVTVVILAISRLIF